MKDIEITVEVRRKTGLHPRMAGARQGVDMTSYRQERIERLLEELRYEVERGMMEREIDEQMVFTFFVPTSKEGRDWIVSCEFRTRPMPHYALPSKYLVEGPKLRVIQGDKS